MSYISDEVQLQVTALEAREKTLATHAKRLSPISIGLAGASFVAGVVARFLGPDKQPSSIDMPSKVLELFSANIPSSGGVPFVSAAGALHSAISSMMPKVMFVTFLVILIGGALAVIKEELDRAVIAAIGGVMMVVALLVFSMNGELAAKQVSPRDSFMEAVEKHQYNTVLKELKLVKLDGTTAGVYVLAQVSIAGGEVAAKHTRKDELERAVALPQVGPTFTPSGQALYAIEHAAFGAPKSPAAVAYQDESLARQGGAKATAVILVTLSAAVGGLAFGFFALRRILAQRVRRIQALLANGAATANNNWL